MPDLFHHNKIDETLEEYRRLALQLQLVAASAQELIANANAHLEALGAIVRTINAALSKKDTLNA